MLGPVHMGVGNIITILNMDPDYSGKPRRNTMYNCIYMHGVELPESMAVHIQMWLLQVYNLNFTSVSMVRDAIGYVADQYRVCIADRQAAMAAQAGTPAEERLNRLRLQGQVASLEEHFNLEYPEETLAEEAAWIALVEALAGLSAFFASTDSTDGKPAAGLRGARTATYAALGKATRGFHTAFPDEMVKQGVTSAIQKATDRCVDAFMADIEEEDQAQRDQLRAALEACVREVLEKAVMTEE